MGFFGWWSEQSPWVRYGVALLLIALSTIIFFAGRIWIWGWVSGFILLLFAGPSKSEKSGYHF